MTFRLRASVVLTGVVGLLMALAGSGIPYFWGDERATLHTATLPWHALWPFLRKRDAVHGVYYVLMHPWLAQFGSSHVAARFPSAVAVAIAVAGVAAVGERLAGPRAGIGAALVLALLPVTSHYGMEARSYALTCALVTWAGYFLIRASEPGAARRWWVGYAVLLLAAGAVFMYALLIGLAHALSLLFARLSVRVQLPILLGVGVLASPLILLASRQSGQVSWISRVIRGNVVDGPLAWVVAIPQTSGGFGGHAPTLLHGFAVLLGALLWLLVAWTVVSLWHHHRPGLDVISLALPWLALPAGLLVAASLVRPMFVERYVFFSAPAFALLAGYALAQFSARALTACVAVLVLLATPLWIADRQPHSKTGHAATRTTAAPDQDPRPARCGNSPSSGPAELSAVAVLTGANTADCSRRTASR